jgi:rhodanese-related sulfurtransferase
VITLKRGLTLVAAGMAILAAAFSVRNDKSASASSAASSPSVSSASNAVAVLSQPTTADLAHQIEREDDHVTALELAQWIRERKPGLRVLDIRSETEFDAYHIPSAERMPLGALATLKPSNGETLVLYSEGGAHAAQGWVLLRSNGHREVYFLRGGLLDWMEDVMSPALPTDTSRARIAALSRYFGGVPRVGAVPVAGAPTTTGAAAAVARVRRRGC